MEILVGCSGYSYRGWRGKFYPQDLPRYRFIEYYEEHFPAVELNFTFYKMENARTTIRNIVRRTKRLIIVAKLHRNFTHRRKYGKEDVDTFLKSIEPALEAGRFGAILAQFPSTFERTTENIEFIENLRKDLTSLPLSIEFRSNTWLDEETLSRIGSMGGISIVNVDAPPIEGLFIGPWKTYGDFNYVRLHGRNREGWSSYRTRYNYDYSREELEEIARQIKNLKELKTFVFFNNTPYAPMNARTLMEILSQG